MEKTNWRQVILLITVCVLLYVNLSIMNKYIKDNRKRIEKIEDTLNIAECESCKRRYVDNRKGEKP